MATIGTFTKTADGFNGTLKTLTTNVAITIKPAVKDNEKAPDFRIFADDIEVGAGWRRSSQAGRDYVSCKLDDPAFPAPVFASLVTSDEGKHSLIWSR